jgi:integrase
MPLTIKKIEHTRSKEKQFKLSDGGGLYLLVHPNNGKYWRVKYRFEGKEKTLSLGTFPEISLAEAREKRDAAKKQLANGIDPNDAKRARGASRAADVVDSFESVAREWHRKFSGNLTPDHAADKLRRLENNVFPTIGAIPVADLRATDLLPVLERISDRGAVVLAHRVRSLCGEVVRHAVRTGRANYDFTPALREAIPPPPKDTHFAAITDPKEVGPLLRAIDGYQGSSVVRWAMQLAPLVFVRPGELQKMEWSEIDFDNSEWNIPAEKMKIGKPHLVPLSYQAVAILREAHALTGSGQYVFPSHRTKDRPLCDNALLAALRRMGYTKQEMTPHGFRAMARTILDEVLNERPDLIEHQLAHTVRDPLGRAYNRTTHLDKRRIMMQRWANYLDELKSPDARTIVLGQ